MNSRRHLICFHTDGAGRNVWNPDDTLGAVLLFLYYNCVLKMFILRIKDWFRLPVKLQWSAKLIDAGNSEWIVGGGKDLRPGDVFRSTKATGAAVQSITCLLWVSPQEESAQSSNRCSMNLCGDIKSMLQKGGGQHLKICLSSSPAGMVSYQWPLKPITTFTPRPCLTKLLPINYWTWPWYKIGWLKDSLVALPTSLRTES